MIAPPVKKNGFTLLEILIAVFILGVVLSTVYAAYSSTLTTIKEMGDASRSYKMARITLDRIMRDLSSLQPYAGAFVLHAGDDTIGSRRFSSLSFWSAAHLAFGETEISGYPASIAYFVLEDPDGKSFSLWRSDVPDVKPWPGKMAGGGMIICQNIQTLNLKYYDESGRENDRWDTSSLSAQQKGKAPAVVQVELSLVNAREPEKPFKFMTRIFLPVEK
ncbi:MAG: type II secretion system protein [Desulfobacteraceae bacterium]|nr:MAG: type II secretion system protein [Desulfobacteraceae bacterium]